MATSLLVYFSPSAFLSIFNIFLPKRMKGPQRPFSTAICSSGQRTIKRLASFATFASINALISEGDRLSKSYRLGTLIYKPSHLIKGPKRPFPLVTGFSSKNATGASAVCFSLISSIALSKLTSIGSSPLGMEINCSPNFT